VLVASFFLQLFALISPLFFQVVIVMSEAVTVTGTPTLALNDNGTATYDAGKSTATSLVFDYTVASSDTNVSSLQVNSLNLPSGATIQDGGGNNLNLLSVSSVPTYSGPQIDTDTGEQASLKLTVPTVAINASTASAVAFTIAGLEAEDTGTVTFTDVNHKAVAVNVTGLQSSYTANLTTLADGAITSLLAVNTDTAGNKFTPVAGTSGVTLTQLDHWNTASTGNWTTTSNWATWNGTHAVPTNTIDADLDKSGTYTVSINSPDTAYALLLNDSGATVSDGSKGHADARRNRRFEQSQWLAEHQCGQLCIGRRRVEFRGDFDSGRQSNDLRELYR